jgi:hypothetical protein
MEKGKKGTHRQQWNGDRWVDESVEMIVVRLLVDLFPLLFE